MKHPLPESAFKKHIAVVGATGGGKTFTAKGIVEHILAEDPRARVCILDPIKSDWWGITSSASGKRAGLPFHILGGPRGHVPLHESTGKAIGELVGSGALPLSIIDMADFGPGGLQTFFNDFAPALIRKIRGVVHLVLEESHEFAPKERAGFGGETMTVHFAKKLATAGRSKGIRLIVATQRTQQLHNSILGSCQTVIAHQLTYPADIEPVEKWFKAHVAKEVFEQFKETITSLPTGTGWMCIGQEKIAKLVQFPRIATFDNSATPDGAEDIDVTTAPVDRAHLREIMGEAAKEAEANDPATLKKRIRELEAELAKKPITAVDEDAVRNARQTALTEGMRIGFDEGAKAQRNQYGERIRTFVDTMDAASKALLAPMPHPSGLPSPPPIPTIPVSQRKVPMPVHTASPPVASKTAGGSGAAPAGSLKPAHQRVINAIGWWHQIGKDPVERDRACVVAGLSPKASTFGVYVSELIKMGLVESSPGKVALTGAGSALAVVPRGDSRQQIHDTARDMLSPQEQRVFDVIYAAHPNEISRDYLADAVGLSRTASTLGVYISGIASYGIVENGSRGHVRAAPWLFVEK